MMKQFLVISVLAALALGAPQGYNPQSYNPQSYNPQSYTPQSYAPQSHASAPSPTTRFKDELTSIVSQENNNNGLGPYSFSYTNSDGSSRNEAASIVKNPGGEESLLVTGSYSYVGTDGIIYTYKYEADANGYRVNRVV